MVDVRVEVKFPDSAKFLALDPKTANASLGTIVQEGALFGVRTVVGFTPVDTGGLKGSIQPQEVGPLAWRVVSALYYAPFVEDDTRAHLILPKNKKVLKFRMGSGTVFSRGVKHPGTRGYHMFARSVPIIVKRLEALVSRAFS